MKKEGRRVDVEHDTDVGFKDNGVVTSDGGEVTMVVLLLLSLLTSSTCDKKQKQTTAAVSVTGSRHPSPSGSAGALPPPVIPPSLPEIIKQVC